jgi:hypothetical protein
VCLIICHFFSIFRLALSSRFFDSAWTEIMEDAACFFFDAYLACQKEKDEPREVVGAATKS